MLAANVAASLLANVSGFLLAALIPTGLLRWKTQACQFRSLPAWQKLFAAASILTLAAVWIYALLVSAGSLMRLGTPDNNFIMLN